MARLQETAFPAELIRLGEACARTSYEVWRGGLRAWLRAVQDAAEDVLGRADVPRGAPNWLGAFVRGARTYCTEMGAVLPRATATVVREIDEAMPEPIGAQTQECANMADTRFPTSRRQVRMFIIDPDPRVPVDKCMVWERPEPTLTDLTDEELWFEEALNSADDIQTALDTHNERRRELSKPEAPLDKVRFHDLQRKVVTTAQF